MNKLVKGAVAGAAGIALLLGGAGTFALWNASTSVSTGSVTTGTLAFGTNGTPTWTDLSAGAATTTWNPATQSMVPGDVVTLTQTVTVNATGKNLAAQLAYSIPTSAIPADLTGKLVPTMTVTKVSGDATVSGTGSPYTITPTAGGTSVFSVVLTFTFDRTTSGVVGQNEAVSLSGSTFTLTQIHS
jgi:alternate signal-mediated exported protein